MSLYLHQNGQQTGPFSDEQVNQMLASGSVRPDAMCWKEGMTSWLPLSSLRSAPVMPGLPAVPYAPPPDKKGSLFGTISFSYSIVSLFGWIALFVVAGMLHKNDSPSDSTNVIVGAFMMGGLALNFIAMLLGVAGAVQAQKKTISILGACVNGMLMLGIFGIVLLGLASQGMRS